MAIDIISKLFLFSLFINFDLCLKIVSTKKASKAQVTALKWITNEAWHNQKWFFLERNCLK